jgi:hypothetical protein
MVPRGSDSSGRREGRDGDAKLLGWQPTHPGLIADLDQGHYFHKPAT